MPCAEIIPVEPDTANTGEGKSKMNVCCLHSIIPKVYLFRGMTISINNQTIDIKIGTTLFEVLSKQLGTQPKGFAVAINSNVVSKADWEKQILYPNDQILIIKATQGG